MRIVAGKHRGMVLYEFDADNIRPTIDRVRESIFNKIQFGVTGSVVLDLFCGTGAVSLEFLSRGAERVVSVDSDPRSIALTRKNFAKAKEHGEILQLDYMTALDRLNGIKFDYIFLDPPYDSSMAELAMSMVSKSSMLQDDGIIIYEHLVGKEFNLPADLELVDEKKYGTVVVSYIRNKSND